MYNNQTHILQVQVLVGFGDQCLSIDSSVSAKVFLIPLMYLKGYSKG